VSNNGRNIWLNVAPLEIPDVEIAVETMDYDDQKLRSLRSQFQSRYLFKRGTERKPDGNTHQIINAIQLGAEKGMIGGRLRHIPLRQDLGLSAALMRECLINSFAKAKSRKLLDYNPLQVLMDQSTDLLRAAFPGDVPSWLSARVVIEVDTRHFHFEGAEPFVGIVINPRVRRRIARKCSEWIADGFDIRNLWVCESIAREDERFEPASRLCGRVVSHEAGILTLADYREEYGTVEAKDVELEARFDAWGAVLNFVFGPRGDAIRHQIDLQQSKLAGGREKYERVQSTFKSVAAKTYEVLPGVQFRVGEMLHEVGARLFPRVEACPPTLYVFDPAGNRRPEAYASIGLNKHGPYNQATQTPVKPRICVICEANKRGEVEQFLQKFFQGVSPEPGKKSYFPLGLTGTYRLRDPDWRCFTTDGASALAYRRASIQALEAGSWDLAIIQIDDASHDLKGADNPYLICKGAFLSQQIPVQAVETQTINYTNSQLQFAMSNMALASYAKLGGVPWVLQVTKPYAHELVIGIGSAVISDSRLGKKKRVVGITTMFTNEGQYLLGNLSRAVDFEEYREALAEILVASVNEARQKLNWQKNEEVRLVFHSFKPLRDDETVNAAMAVAEHLRDFAVEIAFLHVAAEQPLTLFDLEQAGADDWESRSKKGILAPTRSQYLMMNRREALLTLTGPREVKSSSDGLPTPVLLRLHRESRFTDMHYLTRQVFAFSCHSWRGFSGAPMPVTIMYSQLIARLLGKLEALPNWNPDALIGRMNRLRWFL